jgi:beta-hydroxyacyl-ACP dehydratase FabZ
MSAMTHAEILKALPHRYPFLLVDRVVECDDKTRIVAIKNVTFNEPFFQGHFPGDPIMPGVLQLEAMAQAGGVLIMRVLGGLEDMTPYFMSIDKAKFRKIVRPGDQLRIEVEILKMRASRAKFAAKVSVDGNVVSEAEMMCMLAKSGEGV